ncbi:hypothetical protein SAMN02910317_00435 [Ruminococcaceae bacterium FB2012]|nr:hypothetical protein SAMN02910317_00435 [Ruminococcaceae bacterium FB2012]
MFPKLISALAAAALALCSVLPAGAEAPRRNVLKGVSLSLNGEIGVNFYLDLQNTSAFDSFSVTGPNGETVLPLTEVTAEDSGENAGLYKVSCPVDPTQLDTPVSLRLKKGDSVVRFFDGEGCVFGEKGASVTVREYIGTVKAGGHGSGLEALAGALDVYGKYAEAVFSGAEDPGLEDILPAADGLNKYRFSSEGDLPSGVKLLGTALLIDSDTSCRIYFDKHPGEVSVDGAPASVGSKDGKYYIEVRDIPAAELDRVHTAKAGGCSMEFCALSYACSVLNGEDPPAELAGLSRALYAYSFAADMYFKASGGEETPTVSASELSLAPAGESGYTFSYGGEEFTAVYSSGGGGSWKIVDSYRITNKADMTVICEALLREHKVRGCITEYRTAADMAEEWEIHNRGYGYVKDLPMFAGAAARLKDVDLDRKDQGKSFEDFAAEYFG